MRLHAVTLMLMSLAITHASAESSSSVSYPECALSCKQQVFTDYKPSCADTDTSCLCADTHYQTVFADCVSANCTIRESLTAKYVGSRECDIPIVRRYPEVDAATIVPFIIATVLFGIRIAAKAMRLGGNWGPDDVTICIAYALAIIIFSLNTSMVHYGFGMNTWDIMPLDNITKAMKRFYAFVLFYKALISLAKISVCLFLLRIFQSTVFRYTTYTMIAVNAAIAIAWIFADVFHCMPIHLAWTGWEGEEQGKCIDFVTSTFVNGYVNIVVDTIMVTMPVWEVLKLNLSFQKKMGVALMFAGGLVLTIIGIVRVIVFSRNDSNANPLYEMEALNHWSVIECQIAIVCACLPTTRAMLVRFFPGVLGLSTEQALPYTNAGSSRGGGNGSRQVGEKSQISKRVSYAVDYGTKQKRDSGKFIQLVEVGADKS